MSEEVCLFPNCSQKRLDMRSYRNCNKCWRSVGDIYTSYCNKHHYGDNPKTKCRYLPPTHWSCIRCYPEDFDNWIPDEAQGTVEEWKNYLARSKSRIEFHRNLLQVYNGLKPKPEQEWEIWWKSLKARQRRKGTFLKKVNRNFNQMTKIIVVGPQGAGKTSICRRYAYDEFTSGYRATIGVEYYVRGTIQLWDIAGQERIGAMTTVFYRGADGGLIVVDVTDAGSVTVARNWIEDVLKNISIPLWIMVNKVDRPCAIEMQRIWELRSSFPQVMGWSGVSAKTGAGIVDGMDQLCQMIVKQEKEKEMTFKLRIKGEEEERDELDDCCL